MSNVVTARRFWVLILVALALAVAFHFWWPQHAGLHSILRIAVGTAVLVGPATAVVLSNKSP